ncbi:MAG: polyamine aminopropyltransferase [Gammaproteobacteria bacterium]|nr:polyamine aminopropyltransferase [Gammaproteobacteria bacterium]
MSDNLPTDNWFTETSNGFGMSLQVKRKLYEEQSPYQKIEVFETGTFGNLLTLDGITMLTGRDNFIYHEMMAHPALFSHAGPEQVVIVGGGDCGTLREVLKHPGVKKLVQVELDERVTRVAERFFPELCESNNDPRAEFLFQDAIAWMREAEASSADIIILDTTDPVGQAERLFEAPFYSDCRRVLRDGGILVAQSESPFLDTDLLTALQGQMRQAGFTALKTLQFYLPTYPCGWWSATLAAKNHDFEVFRDTSGDRNSVKTRYYSAEIYRASAVLPPFLQPLLTGQ